MTESIVATTSDQLESCASLKCSVIGIGNAGNQILNVADRQGLQTFAINSSKQDLADAVVNSSIKSFIIGDEARGAGKNRAVAKKLFKMNGKELLTKTPAFISMCESSDIIIVAGSTAGGTGSGVAPDVVRLLSMRYPQKIIIFYGILPRLTDSVTAQQNSIDCVYEISELDVPYILADLQYYKGVSNDIAYTSIADHIVDTLKCITGSYLNKSSYGMIDENDMRTTISTPGYCSIYNLIDITQRQIDTEDVQTMMIKKIKNSPAADIERDGNIAKMAVIINMPESMTDSSKTGDYETLQKYTGRPMTVFENYALTSGATGQMCLILTGQSKPYTRLKQLDDIVKEAVERAARVSSYDMSSSYKRFADEAPSFLTSTSDEENAQADSAIDDFFA